MTGSVRPASGSLILLECCNFLRFGDVKKVSVVTQQGFECRPLRPFLHSPLRVSSMLDAEDPTCTALRASEFGLLGDLGSPSLSAP